MLSHHLRCWLLSIPAGTARAVPPCSDVVDFDLMGGPESNTTIVDLWQNRKPNFTSSGGQVFLLTRPRVLNCEAFPNTATTFHHEIDDTRGTAPCESPGVARLLPWQTKGWWTKKTHHNHVPEKAHLQSLPVLPHFGHPSCGVGHALWHPVAPANKALTLYHACNKKKRWTEAISCITLNIWALTKRSINLKWLLASAWAMASDNSPVESKILLPTKKIQRKNQENIMHVFSFRHRRQVQFFRLRAQAVHQRGLKCKSHTLCLEPALYIHAHPDACQVPCSSFKKIQHLFLGHCLIPLDTLHFSPFSRPQTLAFMSAPTSRRSIVASWAYAPTPAKIETQAAS